MAWWRRSSPQPGEFGIRSENNVFYAAGTATPRDLRVQFDEVEQRAITSLPWDRGGPTATQSVDTDRALTLVPIYAAVRLLADSIASLPIHLYRKGKGGVPEQLPDPQLLVKPEINGNLYDWMHRLVTSLALRGNAFGQITNRDSY